MIEVISLLGPSYSGKSILAEATRKRLELEGLHADIIKKDDAMTAIGKERYGDSDTTGGYSVSGFLRHGRIPSSELHAWMNNQIKESLGLGRIAILEGGTRTRGSQAETLREVDLDEDGLHIFMLNLPFRELMRRARTRRQISGRYDDSRLIAFGKLMGQYKGMHSSDAPKPTDEDVTPLDATLPTEELAEIVSNIVLECRATS